MDVQALSRVAGGTWGGPGRGPVQPVPGPAWLAVLYRPRLVLALYAASIVSNASTVIGPVGPLSIQIAMVGLLGATVVVGLLVRALTVLVSLVVLLVAAYLAGRFLSSFGAEEPEILVAVLPEDVKHIVPFVLAGVLLAGSRSTRSTAVAAVATAALLAALSLVRQFLLPEMSFAGFVNVPLGADVGSATERHSGPEADPNFWSRHLVLVLPLALALAVSAREGRARHLWWVAAILIAGGQYLTQSRGGLLASMTAVAVWVLASGMTLRRRLAVLLGGAAVVFAVPGVGSRLLTLGMVEPGTPSQSDQSLVDRAAAQAIAARMAAENPVFGVGAGGFLDALPRYQRLENETLSQPLAPHNLYLEMLAESGVFGLLGVLVMVVGSIVIAARAVRTWRLVHAPDWPYEDPHDRPGGLALGLVAGLVGWSLSSVFLHLAGEQVLLLALAMVWGEDVGARQAMAKRSAAGVAPHSAQGRSWTVWTVVPVLAAVLAGGGAATAMLAVGSGRVWTATSSVVVVAAPVAESSPYSRDVLSRPQVMAGHTALATRPGLLQAAGRLARVDDDVVRQARFLAGNPFGSEVIELRATHPDPDVATRLAQSAALVLERELVAMDGLYRLSVGAMPDQLEPVADRPVGLAVGVGAVVGLGTAGLGLRLRRRQAGGSATDAREPTALAPG